MKDVCPICGSEKCTKETFDVPGMNKKVCISQTYEKDGVRYYREVYGNGLKWKDHPISKIASIDSTIDGYLRTPMYYNDGTRRIGHFRHKPGEHKGVFIFGWEGEHYEISCEVSRTDMPILLEERMIWDLINYHIQGEGSIYMHIP